MGFFSPLSSEGMMQIGMFINFPYLITFMILAWIVNKAVKSKVLFKFIKPRMRTFWRSTIIGILLAVLFFLATEEFSWREILRYFVTLVIAEFVLWGGVKEIIPTIAKNYNAIMEPFRRGRKRYHYDDYHGEYDSQEHDE